MFSGIPSAKRGSRFTQAMTPAKRQAQNKVVQIIRPDALGAPGTC